jgi:hypothetical protein
MTIVPSLQPEEEASSLALAVVASSSAPLLLLNGDLMVIAASASFCREFQINPTEVSNRQLSDLGAWRVEGTAAVLAAARDRR